MKTCNKCEIPQPKTNYYKHKLTPDGLASTCKQCVSEYGKAKTVALHSKGGKNPNNHVKVIPAPLKYWQRRNVFIPVAAAYADELHPAVNGSRKGKIGDEWNGTYSAKMEQLWAKEAANG